MREKSWLAGSSLADSFRGNDSHLPFTSWRVVEVGAAFVSIFSESGVAFILVDEIGDPVLARASPIAAGPDPLLREAIALREALKAMVELGEEQLLFICPSLALWSKLVGEGSVSDAEVEHVLRECVEWVKKAPAFRLAYRGRAELESVQWLAKYAAWAQQHVQWDGQMMRDMPATPIGFESLIA